MSNLKEVIERLKINEGYRSKVYKCSEGFDTIGYGFAIKDLELSEEVSTKILTELVIKKHEMLKEKLSWYNDLPQEVKGVCIEMTYQMGYSGFLKFKKAITHMQNKEWQLAADEMLDSLWAKQTPNRAKELAQIVAEHG